MKAPNRSLNGHTWFMVLALPIALLWDFRSRVLFFFAPLLFNPDYAVGIVTRVEKPQRNEKLERFCAKGILVNMLRSKIGKQALQQGFSGRSRWLLHNLGLMQTGCLSPSTVTRFREKPSWITVLHPWSMPQSEAIPR